MVDSPLGFILNPRHEAPIGLVLAEHLVGQLSTCGESLLLATFIEILHHMIAVRCHGRVKGLRTYYSIQEDPRHETIMGSSCRYVKVNSRATSPQPSIRLCYAEKILSSLSPCVQCLISYKPKHSSTTSNDQGQGSNIITRDLIHEAYIPGAAKLASQCSLLVTFSRRL